MARVDLEELERKARHDAEMLDGWHGDPSKRGSWIGHREHALNVVALIARIRELEAASGSLVAILGESIGDDELITDARYCDARAILEKEVFVQ